MKNLSAGLGWLGLTLILFPLALICALAMVAVVIATPLVGAVLVVLVLAWAAGKIANRKKG